MEWTKEFPSLKYGSWFWLRDLPNAEPQLRQITGGHNWLEAFGMVCDTTEFLSPITPAQAEQPEALCKAATDALPIIEEAQRRMQRIKSGNCRSVRRGRERTPPRT